MIGRLFIVTAIRGNHSAGATQLEKDLLGSGGFLIWVGAIILLGVLGAVSGLERSFKLMIILILVVYVLAQQGLWVQAETALAGLQAPAPTSPNDVGAAVGPTGSTAPASGGAAVASSLANTAASVTSGGVSNVVSSILSSLGF